MDGWKTALSSTFSEGRNEGIPDRSPKTEGTGDFSSDPCEREKGEKIINDDGVVGCVKAKFCKQV